MTQKPDTTILKLHSEQTGHLQVIEEARDMAENVWILADYYKLKDANQEAKITGLANDFDNIREDYERKLSRKCKALNIKKDDAPERLHIAAFDAEAFKKLLERASNILFNRDLRAKSDTDRFTRELMEKGAEEYLIAVADKFLVAAEQLSLSGFDTEVLQHQLNTYLGTRTAKGK